MDAQFNHNLLSSAILYLEHKLLEKGNAYTNLSSIFYAVTGDVQNLHTYAAPFKPFVSDHSIAGANKITGVYIGNTFHSLGNGGLTGINFAEGLVYLTGAATGTVSGTYAIQDFFVTSTADPDEEILFEKKYNIRPKTISQSGVAGLRPTEFTVPAIFLKHDSSFNEERALGGLEDTQNTLTCFILADSQYLLDGATSIIRDLTRDYIPEVPNAIFPFNALGSNFGGVNYNYDTLTSNRVAGGSGYYIQDVDALGFTRNIGVREEIKKTNPKLYVQMLSIETSFFRQARAC